MVEVRISRDGMTAEVSVTPEPGEEITETQIEDNLRMEGVLIEIDREIIADIIKRQMFGEFVEVAKGKLPVDGVDGYYDYFFAIDRNHGKPRVREDGSVDYSKMIVNVREGDLLAEYHPATNGSFGYNVFAKTIAPVRGKTLQALRCSGVRKDQNRYYAEKDGSASLNDNAISVQNILEIHGDANYNSGNIRFNGDVHVSGNIISGITVWAEGSVIVDGVIEDARVFAGQDVIVSRGIHGQGMHKDEELTQDDALMIEAKGNLSARFIDHAHVRAGGTVMMDYAIGSIIEAGGKVTAGGSKGIIAGGCTMAMMGVEADRLGNDAELFTEIRAGGVIENDSAETDGEQQRNMNQAVRQGRLSPVIVRKMIYPNVKVVIGDVYVPDIVGRYGVEFRKINGRIICKAIGGFSAEEILSGVVDVDAQTVAEEKTRVLVIDDDARFLRTVYRILGEEDYQVAVAKSGNAARKYLGKNSADLILLDYMMPGENGVEVLNSLRAWDKTRDIPVVFLTGLDDKKKIIECLSLRPAGYILKPVDKEKLLAKICAVIGCK